jgi:hypothetical protein
MTSGARARHDPERGGRVVGRRKLLYTGGPDAALDRPSHVRAGSALARLGTRLVVIQDDACFVALLEPTTGEVHDIPFGGDGGRRQFDDRRGNKKQKLDLEAAVVLDDTLVALGSGSSPRRERVVLVRGPVERGDPAERAEPEVRIVDAHAFYAILRGTPAFAGAELNLEGAAYDRARDDVILFQRGNGAPTKELAAVDATARVASGELLAMLIEGKPPPPVREILPWDLGTIDGARLTFTDGSVAADGTIAFLACAEASPDVTRDGPVSAVAIGSLSTETQTATLGLLLDEAGRPLLDKAEGLAFDPADRTRAFVVTDRDDPDAPSELLEIRLGGAWS